jgi:ornithine carbamoyltransferase
MPAPTSKPLPGAAAVSSPLIGNPGATFDPSAVLARALEVEAAAARGAAQPLLRGKNVGLMAASDRTPEAALFRRAATELGARVARIGASLSDASPPADLTHTARLLGRLYDAVECQGLSSALVHRIGAEAGIPVFEAAASDTHPSATLASRLPASAPEDARRFVLQALLLQALG